MNNDVLVWDADDFGVTHSISDVCQSRDCRDKLDEFHYLNPNFKATLFAIPAEITYELAEWCRANNSWIELAVHGIFHTNNYECANLTYDEFDRLLKPLKTILETYFVKGFKAPGWQISDDIYRWLQDYGWWVADQAYNNDRRPTEMPAYVNTNGSFSVWRPGEPLGQQVNGKHHHVWDCEGNGVYQSSDEIRSYLQGVSECKFISELF